MTIGGCRLVAIGCWRWLATSGWWRLVVGGSWWLAVGGPLGRFLAAVLDKKHLSSQRDPPVTQTPPYHKHNMSTIRLAPSGVPFPGLQSGKDERGYATTTVILEPKGKGINCQHNPYPIGDCKVERVQVTMSYPLHGDPKADSNGHTTPVYRVLQKQESNGYVTPTEVETVELAMKPLLYHSPNVRGLRWSTMELQSTKW